MKCFIGFLVWMLTASSLPMAAQQMGATPANEPQLDNIRIDHDVDMEDRRMLDIFEDLLRDTGIHGGFVEMAVCTDLPKGRLQIQKGLTVREAMDALVAANPGYEWQSKDGVVNLMPKGGAPLLDTRIAKFQKDATDREIFLTIHDVLNLPEVRKREEALGIKEGPGQGGLWGFSENAVPRVPVPMHIDVRDISLQEVLNAIVQATPKAIWWYVGTDCGGVRTFIVQMAKGATSSPFFGGGSIMRLIGLFAWIVISSAWPISTQQLEAAQAKEPQPADISINHDIHIEDQPMGTILWDILRGTGLHGGTVEVTGCSDSSKGQLQIKQGATVQQAMDELVAENPGYEWELKDGAVNLMPRGAAPLLRTRISKFQMDATDREFAALLQDLLRLPEVRASEVGLGLSQGVGQDASFGGAEINPVPRQPVPVHIDLQNLSLQEAFNKVMGLSPDGLWMYRETDCNGAKTYTVDMRSDY